MWAREFGAIGLALLRIGRWRTQEDSSLENSVPGRKPDWRLLLGQKPPLTNGIDHDAPEGVFAEWKSNAEKVSIPCFLSIPRRSTVASTRSLRPFE